jgi:hypothetical protein
LKTHESSYEIILSYVYIKERMFKQLSNFLKSNGTWIFVILVVIFAIWLLTSYSNNKKLVKDAFDGSLPMGPVSNAAPVAEAQKPVLQQAAPVALPAKSSGSSASCGYSGQPVANPQDLLPVDKNSQWAALNPVNNGNPQIPDLLQAGNLIGLDTIGQTLKNANLQLRSDPIIPKKDIGPWNQSTYEPDLGRVPLELGCGQP